MIMGTTKKINIGHNLDTSIMQVANGNSCWGHVIVRNDLPLELNCKNIRVNKIHSSYTRQSTSYTYLENTNRNQLLDLTLILNNNNRIDVSMLQTQLIAFGNENRSWFCKS